ncbi:MAG: M1 family metallopeptidase [Thermoplasmata archaeon]|nr:M1 family metallopeptidase [Thermoplasmata archaeon]
MNVQAYHLDLTVDYRSLAFRGHLRIEGTPDGEQVYLNAVGLTVSRALAGSTELEIKIDPAHQQLIVSGLPRGTSSLELDYEGKVLTDGLVGFYRSHFGDGYLLTTQFAAIEARRLLPCVDRPDRKAVFHVSVTVDKGLQVIFNTPAESSSDSNGNRTTRFGPTPRMATYLLYLGIGHFDVVRGHAGSVELAAFTPPGRGSSGRYALGLAEKLLPEYERYYGIPYPLPKLDLVAVPEFWAGAMENWGAIAFSEVALLADEGTSTLRRRAIAETTAHEMAHMWFGNLVTMSWWSDVWLNESFATFMSYRILDRAFPDFDSWSDFLPRWSAPAFRGDSLQSTHPIFQPVENPDQIAQIFDEISYGKGASVLRMIERYLGEEAFRQGVNTYLQRFQYANASHEDLWTALEEASSRPVRHIMDAWISRPGVPLLVARVIGSRLTIDQRRFLCNGRHTEEFWPVPVVARIDGVERRMLVEQPHTEIELTSDAAPFLNVDASGFYRVLYDLATLEQIREAFPRLSAFDQWAVVHDLAPFVQAGDLDLDQYLAFLHVGESSTHYSVVNQFGSSSQSLYGLLHDHLGFVTGYSSFLRAQTERLGQEPSPGEPATNGTLREDLLGQRVWVDPEFARRLASRFDAYDRADPDARDAIAKSFVLTGGAAEFELVLRRFRSAPSEGEMIRLLAALTAASDPVLVDRILLMAERKEIPLSLVPFAVRGASRNIAAGGVTWTWLQRNLDAFAANFRGSGEASRLLEAVLPRLGLDRENEVQEFFRDRIVPEGSQGLSKGLELLAAGSALRKRLHLPPASGQA